MKVDTILANGDKGQASVEISPNWDIRAIVQEKEEKLQLQALCPALGSGFVYIFANVSSSMGPVEQMHPCLREVLLFAPLVCFYKVQDGFQALSHAAWKELNASVCFEHYLTSTAATSLPRRFVEEEELSEDCSEGVEDGQGSCQDSCCSEASKESDYLSEASEVLQDSEPEEEDASEAQMD